MNIQPFQAIIIYKIILKKLKIIIFYIEKIMYDKYNYFKYYILFSVY